MTYRDVYIGALSTGSDPFDSGGDWNGNLPGRLSPWFPRGAEACNRLIQNISDGKFPGKQVDFSGWVAKVTKQDILDFIDEVHRDDKWCSDPNLMPHIYEKMQSLMMYVRSLPEDGFFALVADEF